MKYLKICFFLSIFISQLALADQTEIDFTKSIFSGKFVPAPTTSAPKPAPETKSATAAYGDQPTSSQAAQSQPLQIDMQSIPIINSGPAAQNSPSSPAGKVNDTNYTPPPPPVLNDAQKKTIQDAKDYDDQLKKAYDKSLSENFDTYTFPQEYYQRPFTKQNAHLPPADFASYYAGLAFNYVKEDNFVNVRYFIKKYNFVDIYDADGNNLLMSAASYNSLKTARVLLANNIFNINAQNKQSRRTPLHFAVINNHFEMARLLLTMGASPTIKDSFEMTAFDYSNLLENSQISNLLAAYKVH